jgi:hypothetical protein
MKQTSQRNLYLWPLIWINFSNTIQYECIFHEYLLDDDPAGSKHVANVYKKQILIKYIDLFITNCCVDGTEKTKR